MSTPFEFRGAPRAKHHEDDRGAAAIMASRYKTKICQKFEVKGSCPYEVRCMFAHGDAELRTKEMNLSEGITTEDAIKNHRRKLEYEKRHSPSIPKRLNKDRKGEKKGSPLSQQQQTDKTKTSPPTQPSTLLQTLCVDALYEILPVDATSTMNGLSTPESCLHMEHPTSGFDLSPNSDVDVLGGSTNLGSFSSNFTENQISDSAARCPTVEKEDFTQAAIMASHYKTKMCQNFEVKGSCPYEVCCMFAHGDAELRTKEMNLDEGITTEEAIKDHRLKVEYEKRLASSSLKRLNKERKGEKKGSPGSQQQQPDKTTTSQPTHPSILLQALSVDACEILRVSNATPKNLSLGTPNTSTNGGSFGLSTLKSCLPMEHQISGFDLSPHPADAAAVGSYAAADACHMECEHSTSSDGATFHPTMRMLASDNNHSPLVPEPPHLRKLTPQERAQGFYRHSPYAKWQYNAECGCQECVATSLYWRYK